MEVIDIKNKFKIYDLLIDSKDGYKDIEKYNCLICCESLFNKEILQCREGHYYCYSCWNKSLSFRSECMSCRIPIKSINELSRCRFFETMIQDKRIYCPYLFKNITCYWDTNSKLIKDSKYGCRDIIKVEELESHLLECKFKFINCSNDGCNKVLRLNQLKLHQDCQFEKSSCKYCNERILVSSLKNHYSTCLSILVKCTQCPIRLKRGDLSNHINDECNNTIIQCKYKDGGCSAQFKRSELQVHLEKINHTKFVNDLVVKLEGDLKDSNEKYQQVLHQLNLIQFKLTQHQQYNNYNNNNNNNNFKYSNQWIISKFSSINLNIGEYLTSPVISIGNYKFELFFYLNMSKEYMKSFSLFIREVNKSPIRIKFKFKIINNNNSSNNIIKYFTKKLETEYETGLGYPSLLNHKDINKENGWLVDDQFKLEFKIIIKPIINPLESNQ